jgi:hypothetical protein
MHDEVTPGVDVNLEASCTLEEMIAMSSTSRSVTAWVSLGLLTVSWASFAAPQITGTSGTVAHGQQLVINGSGFGSKSPAKPFLWAPFDNSAQPSSLGVVTSWVDLDDLAFAPGEGYAGTGGLKAMSSKGTWTAGAKSSGFAWNDYGQKMYLFRRFKQNFSVTDSLNWKHFRVWAADYTLPDWYVQTGNGNVGVEGGNDIPLYPYEVIPGAISAVRGTPNQWTTDEILVKANLSAASYDGEFYHYVQGFGLAGKIPYQSYAAKPFTIRMSDSQAPMVLVFPVHGVKANTTFPSDYRYWVDDIYLDNTWARVMVGNAPDFAKSTKLEIQIPAEWSSNRISINLNLQSYPAGQPRYLFVVDSNGGVSPGYALEQPPAPQPPADVKVE